MPAATVPVRRDARRNRERILDAGRRALDGGDPLQLNDIARVAGVGVATVYRHFATPDALMTSLADERLRDLLSASTETQDDDPWRALTDFLDAGLRAQLADRAFATVLAAPALSGEIRTAVLERLDLLLTRAQAHRPGAEIDAGDLLALMCGVVTAAHSHGDVSPAERLATARRYLSIVLRGLVD